MYFNLLITLAFVLLSLTAMAQPTVTIDGNPTNTKSAIHVTGHDGVRIEFTDAQNVLDQIRITTYEDVEGGSFIQHEQVAYNRSGKAAEIKDLTVKANGSSVVLSFTTGDIDKNVGTNIFVKYFLSPDRSKPVYTVKFLIKDPTKKQHGANQQQVQQETKH